VLLIAGARCRKAGRGGGGMPRIVSGGGPISEHSTHDVLKYINRSTPLAMLVGCRQIKRVKLTVLWSYRMATVYPEFTETVSFLISQRGL
jgi:hypothetical protein